MRMFLPLPLLVTACVAMPTSPSAASAPVFSALSFFDGRTEGEGRLRTVAAKDQLVRVRGRGHLEPDGTLVLDQTVERMGAPSHKRQWRIREVSPGRYTGTLSDASGPVTGETEGDRLHLAYRLKGGIAADQWLTLEPGGRVARNAMTIRKFGVRVGALDETIRKIGG